MKTILFDLDGTLIQTPTIILEAFKQTFETHLKEVELSEKELSNFLGQTLWQTFEFYTDDKDLVNEMIDHYRNVSNMMIEEGLKAYPNAKKTILYLKNQGCKIGVVTSKLKDVATYHLKLTNLFEDVDLIVGYDDVKNHKPNPDPLLKAIELLNVKKEDTLYVGDHENDIKAAKKAGIESCAVTYSSRLHEMLLEQPEYVIDNLDNLRDII
ncbi:HAD-IA family hydrolase [Mariniplasma anaerobium]|uniref:Pyrophosphatase PpaX n=1 Tax=Mariniplasma anaerobium TaxID=2735436 RepID=A0A7U9TJ74_9MOLU|nr:HAD-IA family hydrolase [Mariniplasma anaerobium]BCR35165.1 pyrophosphatase PpaX [Mariniplasma anaerobium]